MGRKAGDASVTGPWLHQAEVLFEDEEWWTKQVPSKDGCL